MLDNTTLYRFIVSYHFLFTFIVGYNVQQLCTLLLLDTITLYMLIACYNSFVHVLCWIKLLCTCSLLDITSLNTFSVGCNYLVLVHCWMFSIILSHQVFLIHDWFSNDLIIIKCRCSLEVHQEMLELCRSLANKKLIDINE